MPGKYKRKWVHPLDDADLDQQRMMLADPEDPRTLGRGPCRDLHSYNYLNPPDYKEVENKMKASGTKIDYNGNAHCRYGECSVCALRLAYWPRLEAVCTCINKSNPEIVRRALVLIQEWEIRLCTAAIFRKAYKQTQYFMTVDAKARAKQGLPPRAGLMPKTKAKASTSSRATSSNQPTEVVIVDSDDDPEQERRMSEYVNARRWATVTKKLLALARRYEYEQVQRFMEDTAAGVMGIATTGDNDQIYQNWLHWRSQQIQLMEWDEDGQQ